MGPVRYHPRMSLPISQRPRLGCLLRRFGASCAVAVAICAPGPAAAAAIEQLREFAASTRGARGEFTQQQVRADGRGAESARGSFAFVRPGRFRWEVVAPYEQLVVTDGERLHFYDKDLRQVTVRKVGDAISATPAAILFGADDLDARFVLKEAGTVDGLEWLEATPRSTEAGFESIRIGLRAGMPQAMEVRDAFGKTTRFSFRAIERNPILDPALFRFVAPPGVDVVR